MSATESLFLFIFAVVSAPFAYIAGFFTAGYLGMVIVFTIVDIFSPDEIVPASEGVQRNKF